MLSSCDYDSILARPLLNQSGFVYPLICLSFGLDSIVTWLLLALPIVGYPLTIVTPLASSSPGPLQRPSESRPPYPPAPPPTC